MRPSTARIPIARDQTGQTTQEKGMSSAQTSHIFATQDATGQLLIAQPNFLPQPPMTPDSECEATKEGDQPCTWETVLLVADVKIADPQAAHSHHADPEHVAHSSQRLGSILRRIRKKRGWSQTRVGQAARLSQGTLSYLESGTATTPIHALMQTLSALDLELVIRPRRPNQS